MLHQTLRRFIQSEQFGGVLLVACTIVSLVLANSRFAGAWSHLWHLELGPMSVEHWINDALMAIFFLMIGLELERGMYVGALSKVRNALLPAFAAVGGMLAPALIHFAMNREPRPKRVSAPHGHRHRVCARGPALLGRDAGGARCSSWRPSIPSHRADRDGLHADTRSRGCCWRSAPGPRSLRSISHDAPCRCGHT